MCLPMDDTAMLCWLKNQVTVLEAWREELTCRPETSISMITRLEKHRSWLREEISRLDPGLKAA
ncbi:hypothetical protein [Hyphomonas beringensis]|nr:hypothetical protein [Hyphomonas beringensis]